MGLGDFLKKTVEDSLKQSFGLDSEQEKLKAASNEVAGLKKRLAELESENSQLKSKNSTLKNQLDRQPSGSADSAELKEALRTIESLKSGIANLKKQLEAEKKKTAELQKKLENSKAPVAAPVAAQAGTVIKGEKVTPDDIKDKSDSLCVELKEFGSEKTEEVVGQLREKVE